LTVGAVLVAMVLSVGQASSRSAEAASLSEDGPGTATLRELKRNPWSAVANGIVDRQEWSVDVRPERKGICLEATLLIPGNVEASGAGVCSKPVLAGGIFLFEVEPPKGKNPGATVVGGAFNRGVDRVELEGFDGQLRTLPLRRPTGNSGPRRFSYVAFAAKGVLCARRVMPVHEGQVIWSARWQGFSRSVRYGSRVDMRRFCSSP